MKFRSFLRSLCTGSDTTPRLRRPAWMVGERSTHHRLEDELEENRPILSRQACAEGDGSVPNSSE